MEWEEARSKIKGNVRRGTDLNTYGHSKPSRYRVVERINSYAIFVPIGRAKTLHVTWRIRENCWSDLISEGVYNNQVFRKHHSELYDEHDCWVHVVGRIFEEAGLVQFDKGDNAYYVLSGDSAKTHDIGVSG